MPPSRGGGVLARRRFGAVACFRRGSFARLASLLVHELSSELALRRVHIVRATAEPDVVDRRDPALRDGNDVVELQPGPCRAALARGPDERAAVAVTLRDLALHARGNVASGSLQVLGGSARQFVSKIETRASAGVTTTRRRARKCPNCIPPVRSTNNALLSPAPCLANGPPLSRALEPSSSEQDEISPVDLLLGPEGERSPPLPAVEITNCTCNHFAILEPNGLPQAT